MTATTAKAKARLLDLLLEPLQGCAGLSSYRQKLINKVMKMPVLEVKDHLEHLEDSNLSKS